MLDNLYRLYRAFRQVGSPKKSSSDRARKATRRLRYEGLEGRELMTAVPAAPVVMATPVSSTQVDLSWHPVSGASGYLIDEYVNGAWKQIGNFNSATSSVAVNGLSAHTTYYFDVAAYNSAGTDWANYNTVTTLSATVAINHPTAATAYSPVSGNLFGANGPLFTDVHQGQVVGDCWLLASLAEVAARDPNDIRNMFNYQGTTVENGATVGLYSVRFYNSAGAAEQVTVDTELPSGGYADQVTNGVLWVALAEKAYAEANGAGYVTSGQMRVDSYSALNGGDPKWALQAITGKPASDYSINPSNIAAAWNAGELIVLGSSSKAGDNLVVGDSQGTHAYAVVNYNVSSSAPFELSNPWGLTGLGGTVTFKGHQVYGGAFYATASMISQDFSSQSIGAGAVAETGTPGNSFLAAEADAFLPAVTTAGPTGSVANQAQGNAAIDQLFAAWNDDLSFAA